MGVSGKTLDLAQMKDYFEKEMPNIRLISDLKLSEKDFKELGAKLKSAFSFRDSKDGVEEIIICYLVYWVYALHYWEEDKGIHDELTDYCADLPQHQLRHHFQLLLDTFAGYGIHDFGYMMDRIEERCSMLIARHAGIPNDEKYQVFELLDDYRKQHIPVREMVEDIYSMLPYKSKYIFSLLDARSRREILWEIRTIMTEVALNTCPREKLLKKYPYVSVSLIDYCFYWVEERRLPEAAAPKEKDNGTIISPTERVGVKQGNNENVNKAGENKANESNMNMSIENADSKDKNKEDESIENADTEDIDTDDTEGNMTNQDELTNK